MKPMACVSAILFLAIGVSAQTVTRGFGSVVFPGGTSATTPGVTRNFGSVVFPGGSPSVPTVRTAPAGAGTPFVGVRPAGSLNGQNFRRVPSGSRFATPTTMVYAYPVFVGGYDNSMVGTEPPPSYPVQPPPPAPTYPAQPARPVMIQVGPDFPSREPMSAYQAQPDEPASPERYLLAFKDHSVYSAVAYWFDGDTLHYFTSGSVHNQASVSLLDRELTLRLNKELGIEFHMPDAK